ncbi:MAG: membrane protein insertion efficiency factor YidD [Bacteroidetes bacterium]|nr:membrane protein insertion efficiency factor YidD [Bacteroidota bacterium]
MKKLLGMINYQRFAIILLATVFLFSFRTMKAQSAADITFAKEICNPATKKPGYKAIMKKRTISPANWLFLFYKNIFSNQDISQCGFSPSCSEYAYLSVKKFGFIFAIPDIFDRLSRCNGHQEGYYPFDEEKNKYCDSP